VSVAVQPAGKKITPEVVFLVACLCITIAGAIVAIVLRQRFEDSETFSLVSLADLLVTVIAVSGVTVPLAIAYLTLGREADFFNTICSSLPYFLQEKKIRPENIATAVMYWKNEEQKGAGDLKVSLLVVEEILLLRDADPPGHFLSERCRLHIVPDTLRNAYRRYFEEYKDRALLLKYITIVAVLGAVSFVSLYVLYVRIDNDGYASVFHIFTNWLALVTASMNIMTYVYLMNVVRLKHQIKMQIDARMREICDEIRNDITVATTGSRSNEARLQKEIDRGIKESQR